MKKNVWILLGGLIVILCYNSSLLGQRFGVVDLKAVLEKIPEFRIANNQLDILSKTWEGEITEKEKTIKALKEDYKTDELFYTDNLKQKKLDDIAKAEKEAFELSKYYFGYEGALFKKRQELVKPIQDRIYEVIQRIAKERTLDLIIDKSAGSHVLYMDPKVDITTRVLQLLGF